MSLRAAWIYLFLSLFVAAFAIDLLEEGKTIIIQRDVEHVLIKKDLTQVFSQLNKSRKAILTAKRTLAGNSVGADKKVNLKTFFRQLDFMDGETRLHIDSLKSLFKLNKQEIEIKRRGIEILGELISSLSLIHI